VLTAGYDAPSASVTLPDTHDVQITLTDLTTPIRFGLRYPVVFLFERAGALRVELPVETSQVPAPRAEPPPGPGG